MRTLRAALALRPAGWRSLDAQWRAWWALLAALGLIAGLLWRVDGSPPPIFVVLDAAGIAFWAVALHLAPAYDRLFARQKRHSTLAQQASLLYLANARHAAGQALLLAFAPSGVLLAYAGGSLAVIMRTSDPLDFPIPLAALFCASLLFIPPAILLFSTALLRATRRVAGWAAGTVLWGMVAIAAEMPFIGGRSLLRVPTTLGEFGEWLLTQWRRDLPENLYLSEMAALTVGLPLLIALLALLVVALAQWLHPREQGSVDGAWLVASLSTLVVAFRSFMQTALWMNNPGVNGPGRYADLLALGLCTAVTLLAVTGLTHERSQSGIQPLRGMLTLWLAAGAWLVLTLPALRAGQAGHVEILTAFGACLALLTTAAAVVRRGAEFGRRAPWVAWVVAGAVVCIAAIPPAQGKHPLLAQALSFLGQAWREPSQATHAYSLLGCIAVVALIAWPWPRRRPQAAPAAA